MCPVGRFGVKLCDDILCKLRGQRAVGSEGKVSVSDKGTPALACADRREAIPIAEGSGPASCGQGSCRLSHGHGSDC